MFSLLLVGLSFAITLHAADKPARDLDFTLQPQRQFLQLPEGFALGPCSAVAVNSKNEVYVFHRGPRPILCFDSHGKFLRAWGDDLIKMAHGLRVDDEDNVWATDIGGHRAFKFDAKCKVLLSLGTGEPGVGKDQFNKPTDIGFGSKGEFYISDGYGNSRVMKFDAAGKFLKTWGEAGSEPGQFHLPHCIAVGPDGRLFVADGRAAQVLLLDDKGKVRKRWGQPGEDVGEFQMPHMLAFDTDGNIYVADVDGRRLQKFARNKKK
jgi:DNA-binding beta-propeller fold protein YncE